MTDDQIDHGTKNQQGRFHLSHPTPSQRRQLDILVRERIGPDA
jgi:hypothetical protein